MLDRASNEIEPITASFAAVCQWIARRARGAGGRRLRNGPRFLRRCGDGFLPLKQPAQFKSEVNVVRHDGYGAYEGSDSDQQKHHFHEQHGFSSSSFVLPTNFPSANPR